MLRPGREFKEAHIQVQNLTDSSPNIQCFNCGSILHKGGMKLRHKHKANAAGAVINCTMLLNVAFLPHVHLL